jgi:hypothetical protein
MKTEDIIQKYPKIFEHYEGNPGNVNWHGVPKGWLPIIDILCRAIQSYCDSARSIKNPDFDPIAIYDQEDTTSHRYLQVKREQVTCLQMKEKFGGLRFYTNGNDEVVDGMIIMATNVCAHTCESCSTSDDIGLTTGWISVRCKKCAEEIGRNWMTREDWNTKFKTQV